MKYKDMTTQQKIEATIVAEKIPYEAAKQQVEAEEWEEKQRKSQEKIHRTIAHIQTYIGLNLEGLCTEAECIGLIKNIIKEEEND